MQNGDIIEILPTLFGQDATVKYVYSAPLRTGEKTVIPVAKRSTVGLLIILALLLAGCSTSGRITHWRTPDTYSMKHKKIMVVGIVKDSLLRRQMEEHFAGDLKELGYISVSAIQQFGYDGLGKLSQEQTYTTLCDNGIDAVITIVLIDKSKEKAFGRQRFKTNLNSFYYNRIWNYFNMQSDQVQLTADPSNHHSFWETVFFDLSTLQTLYVARTNSFKFSSADTLAHEYGTALVKNMVKQKILYKQNMGLKLAFTDQRSAMKNTTEAVISGR